MNMESAGAGPSLAPRDATNSDVTTTAAETLYKVLGDNQKSFHGGSGKWAKGRWRSVKPPLGACAHGLHLCREGDLLTWLGPTIWLAEAGGERIDQSDKIVVERARIVEKLATWNERTARLFACDCAERTLPLFEKHNSNDKRPRRAIETARRFADGQASREELAAVWDAARSAAVWDAARSAAWSAARSAAWDAARSAAVWDAAWAAVWAAAWDAARSAARSAAGDAAGDAERQWQTARLMAYLRGEA